MSCAHLVIRDLLQVNVGSVDHLHAGVAVVCAAESTPLFGVQIEPVGLLSAALQGEPNSESVTDEHRASLVQRSTKPCVTFTTVAVPRCESGCISI